MRKTAIFAAVLLCLTALVSSVALAYVPARIKDVAKIQGVRGNQLMGQGLVVGLAGTGDSNKSMVTNQAYANMLKLYGLNITAAQAQAKNIAFVTITANLPPFVKPGDTIDVTVSSAADAKSLAGGVLLQTPLRAANGLTYAVAQGALSVGGFSAGGGGSSQQKNFTTVGNIPGGAIVERDVPMQFANNGEISLALSQPDFTTANRVSEAIDARFGPISVARDPGTVTVNVPFEYAGNIVGFVAMIEELPVVPDAAAKVVINERTGTVVMGGSVTIDEVAVAQGGLSVKITRTREISQPPPFSGGTTAIVDNTTVDAKEEHANLVVLPAASRVSDVINALNAVGATPRDMIAILQAMKAAGALRAELQII